MSATAAPRPAPTPPTADEHRQMVTELLDGVDVGPLFEGYRLGGVDLASRWVMAPMTRNRSPQGLPGPDVVDYYVRRADQVGLIVTEGVYIPHESAGTYPDVPAFGIPGAQEAWRRVVDGVHGRGGRIVAQLWHVGGVRRLGMPPVPQAPPVSPSGLDLRGRQVGDPLTEAEIDAIIGAYVAAAVQAQAAGFDGVEIHAAHGYLIDEFHWPFTNRRTDRWGGDLMARARFGAAVVRAVREAVGEGFLVIHRFSQFKTGDYGARIVEDPRELEELLAPVVDAGADALHVSTRRYWEPAFEGSARTLAGWTKRVTGLPVIAVGSVGVTSQFRAATDEPRHSVSLAPLVGLLRAGEFDLVGVGRALLSDPAWTTKVRDGRADRIRWYEKAHESEYH